MGENIWQQKETDLMHCRFRRDVWRLRFKLTEPLKGEDPMSEDTVDRVIGVVYSKFKEHAEGKKITPQTEFKKDLGADSLDAVELAMLLEDEFDIGISDDKMEGVDTVRKAIALVDSLLKG